MEIVALALEHEAALTDFLADFARAGEPIIPAWFPDPEWSFAETVEGLAAWSRGEVPEGRVPTTTRFLVDDGVLLGVSNVRHRLNDRLRAYGGHVGYSVRPSARGRGHGSRLLRGAMAFARGLGIERLLLTCDPANVASVCAIESCGGVVMDESFHEERQMLVRRYEIALSPGDRRG